MDLIVVFKSSVTSLQSCAGFADVNLEKQERTEASRHSLTTLKVALV